MERQRIAIALRSRRFVVTGLSIIMAAVGVYIGIALFGAKNAAAPIVYINVSRNFKVCLLTTTADEAHTASVWPAVQAAARNKPINAQHITAPSGPASQLAPYVNSLLALHCSLVMTAGSDLTDATVTAAKAHPQQTFINLGQRSTGMANVQDITEDSPASIDNIVRTACRC